MSLHRIPTDRSRPGWIDAGAGALGFAGPALQGDDLDGFICYYASMLHGFVS